MKTDYLLFYLFSLISKGKEWQNKDLNGSTLKGVSWFKLASIILALAYVCLHPKGLEENKEIVDFILSSLSITTALLFSILVVVLDRARQSQFNGRSEKEQVNDIHQWNHLYKFASLTCNAILWSIVVIVILVCTMLYGHNVDLYDYKFCGFNNMLEFQHILLGAHFCFVVGIRFVMIYALFRFFVLFLYAVLSLYESICSELDIKQPENEIPQNRRDNVSDEIKTKYGSLKTWFVKLIALLLFLLSLLYAFGGYINS